MIRHDDHTMRDGAFVFASLFDMTCSICAPSSWSAKQVEAFADEQSRKRSGAATLEGWHCVDKAELMPGTGSTPNPCNVEPVKRKHWFLLWEP